MNVCFNDMIQKAGLMMTI